MYDDDDDYYNYDIATKWYSLVSECCIIKSWFSLATESESES